MKNRLKELDEQIQKELEYLYILRMERDLVKSVMDGNVASAEICTQKALKKAMAHDDR